MVRVIKGFDADGDGENDFYISANHKELAAGFQILCWIGAAIVVPVLIWFGLVQLGVMAFDAAEWVTDRTAQILGFLLGLIVFLAAGASVFLMLLGSKTLEQSKDSEIKDTGSIYAGRPKKTKPFSLKHGCFISNGNELDVRGPYTKRELRDRIKAGEIVESEYISNAKEGPWLPITGLWSSLLWGKGKR